MEQDQNEKMPQGDWIKQAREQERAELRRNVIERHRLANEAMRRGDFTEDFIHPWRVNKAKELIKKAHHFRLRY